MTNLAAKMQAGAPNGANGASQATHAEDNESDSVASCSQRLRKSCDRCHEIRLKCIMSEESKPDEICMQCQYRGFKCTRSFERKRGRRRLTADEMVKRNKSRPGLDGLLMGQTRGIDSGAHPLHLEHLLQLSALSDPFVGSAALGKTSQKLSAMPGDSDMRFESLRYAYAAGVRAAAVNQHVTAAAQQQIAMAHQWHAYQAQQAQVALYRQQYAPPTTTAPSTGRPAGSEPPPSELPKQQAVVVSPHGVCGSAPVRPAPPVPQYDSYRNLHHGRRMPPTFPPFPALPPGYIPGQTLPPPPRLPPVHPPGGTPCTPCSQSPPAHDPTVPSMPSKPSVPSMPSMPSVPSMLGMPCAPGPPPFYGSSPTPFSMQGYPGVPFAGHGWPAPTHAAACAGLAAFPTPQSADGSHADVHAAGMAGAKAGAAPSAMASLGGHGRQADAPAVPSRQLLADLCIPIDPMYELTTTVVAGDRTPTP